ncbi:MAG TPA: BON domain-containing protein [Terriglobales bacterium]|nr:BON domain-containing protein [Terriglobales bacterium]
MKKKSLRISASSIVISWRLIFVLGIGVMTIGLGCARKPDDAQISSEIQNKFSQDSGLSSKQLTVQASNGVVTLAGAVDNDAQREAAARQAGSVSGVKEVINNLQVGVAANTPQPAPVQPEASASPANNPKPGLGKKTRRSHSHDDSAMANGNDANQNTNQNAANQNADQQAGQTADQTVASNNATPSPPPPAPADTAPPTPPPPPPTKHLIVDQGTQLTVRLVDPIDSEKNQTGDTFHATLNTALTSDGEEAIPAGTDIIGHLVDVKSAGKFAGQSQVVLQLDSISSGGKTYTLQTDQYKKQAASRGKNTGEKVGGGAILGGIIGALAGGGKGAAVGAAAGAGVGGGVQAATKSQQIKLPSETVLNFTLQAPVTVIKSPNPNADRPKLDNSQ